ncbi:MAG: hypothetical protein KatS3mg090_0271 [Patescibacteria group bacterium]|nr:MAG: hypothetical protein KatS3mg090_0271 [Patescibacteria group bacterium]
MKRLVIAIDLLLVAFFVFLLRLLPPEAPLLFSYLDDEDKLVRTYFLFTPLILANLFFFINEFLMSKYFAESQEQLRPFFNFINGFIIVFSAYLIIRILLLII